MEKYFREIKTEIRFSSNPVVDYPAHLHDDIEIIYVKDGGCVAFCDGKRYELTNDDMFITFPNQVHRYINSKNGEYYCLIIKPNMLLDLKDVFENRRRFLFS